MKIMSRASCLLLLLFVSGLSLAQFPSQLKNVVVIVQENRTPDNLFHFLTPACPIPAGASGYKACTPAVTNACYDVSPCGLSNQSGTVAPVPLAGIPLAGSADPNHSHTAFEQMCDPDSSFKCRNDGAWQTASGGLAYGYVLNPAVTNYDGSAGYLLDPYLTFAKQYGWANFMYQTNQGPSYPAHQFLFTGTSARSNTDDAASIFVSENFTGALGAGCLLPASTATTPVYGAVLRPANPATTGCTLFDNNSVQECKVYSSIGTNNLGAFCGTPNNMATTVLDPHAISWKYYAPMTADQSGYLWTAPNALQSICNPQPDASGNLTCTGAEWAAHVDMANNGTDILGDIASCSLAQVSWVIPGGAWSDHAGPSTEYLPYGPSWVAAVINAIGNNPTCPAGTADAGQTFWNDTAIIVTWDDWGGWSDNQPANVPGHLPCVFTTPPTPCASDYQYGFRVPLLVVSAYTPEGFISNTPFDFGSILRTIEGINRLKEGIMRNADARAVRDLQAFFTLTQPRPYQTVPAVENANYFQTYTGAAVAPDND